MTRALLLLSSLLAGCSAAGMADSAVVDDGDTAAPSDSALRIDVHPPTITIDGGAPPPLSAQTFYVDAAEMENGSTFTLVAPVQVVGHVTGWVVTPWAGAELPGEPIDVAGAEVSLRVTDTIMSAVGVTDENGDFVVDVVPGHDHDVAILPDDPLLPFIVDRLAIAGDVTFDVDLGYGVAVWGRVVDDDDNPVSGVAVHAETVTGVAGAATYTDSDGWYQLRVQPGNYMIVSDGDDDGRDPRLVTALLEVGETGLRNDFRYPPSVVESVIGRAIDEQGNGIAGVTARFASLSLDGYEATATYSVDVPTNDDGNFAAVLHAGTYTVELVPDADDALSPVSLGQIRVSDFTDLGAAVLPAVRAVVGHVVDGGGAPVSGAIVTVAEQGFGQRAWAASTDEQGQFALAVPQVDLVYTIAPPSGSNLAYLQTVKPIDAADAVTPTFALDVGVRLHGTIRYEDDGETPPAPYSVVEIRDPTGILLGTAVTGEDGGFTAFVTLD